jgi:hypothetical protein
MAGNLALTMVKPTSGRIDRMSGVLLPKITKFLGDSTMIVNYEGTIFNNTYLIMEYTKTYTVKDEHIV